jgi:sterol desaturase/sphingolipid hydroxylase (fatty acid hydroxylase superfamily)
MTVFHDIASSLESVDPWILTVVYANIISFITYWFVGGLFLLSDFNFIHFLKDFKMQPGTNTPVDMKKFWALVKVVLRNQAVGLIYSIVVVYPVSQWRGMTMKASALPDLSTLLFHFICFNIIEEIGFYYSHRTLHRPAFYWIHKQHHEWTSPISIAATYCHPIEHILSNVGPLTLGPLIMGSHLLVMVFWINFGICVTLNSHSGYHLPWVLSSEEHDYHHLKYDVNYGEWLACDVSIDSITSLPQHLMFLSTYSVFVMCRVDCCIADVLLVLFIVLFCFLIAVFILTFTGVLGVLDTLHGTNASFFASPQGKESSVYFSPSDAKQRKQRVESGYRALNLKPFS